MSKLIEIKNADDRELFLDMNPCGIVLYGAHWCKACKNIKPFYERLAKRYHTIIGFAYVDIDVCQLDFSKVPVFTGIVHKSEIDSMIGDDRNELKDLIKHTYKMYKNTTLA